MNLILTEPTEDDEKEFIDIMIRSQSFHHPWVKAPLTSQEFKEYINKSLQPNQKNYLLRNETNHILGVFNINEIVRGLFQNSYLGYYATVDFANKHYMSQGLKLVLNKVFHELKLHRIEANIQPENKTSIYLVKSNGFRYEGFSPRYLKINDEWQGHEHWAMTYEDYIQNNEAILKQDKVQLVPYDPTWPEKANVEIRKIREALSDIKILDIQHVGSTAIPNIVSKPIIDILITVESLNNIKFQAITALQKLNYEYWDKNPDTDRLFFVKGMPPFGEKRTHHVHIAEKNSRHFRDKIIFRDFLFSHPEVAKEYEHLKITLAEKYHEDREAYTKAKRDFLDKILLLAAR